VIPFDPARIQVNPFAMEPTEISEKQYGNTAGPSNRLSDQKVKKVLGPIGIVFVVIAKFFAKLKFLILPVLKFFR